MGGTGIYTVHRNRLTSYHLISSHAGSGHLVSLFGSQQRRVLYIRRRGLVYPLVIKRSEVLIQQGDFTVIHPIIILSARTNVSRHGSRHYVGYEGEDIYNAEISRRNLRSIYYRRT